MLNPASRLDKINITNPETRQFDLIALPLGIATGIFLGSILSPTTTTTTTTTTVAPPQAIAQPVATATFAPPQPIAQPIAPPLQISNFEELPRFSMI